MPKKSEKKQATKPVKAAEQKSKKRKILFAGSEAFPFSGTGEFGEVLASLAHAVNESGEYEARVILPLYESFPQDRRAELEFVCWTFVKLAWRNQYCGLFRLKDGNTTFYFIDNEYYFKRKNRYGYSDDGERFAFFSRAVLDMIPKLGFVPDILHCHDWQTALVPIYYKLFYMYEQGLEGIKTVFTIHNIEYQGKHPHDAIEEVFGIPDNEFASIEHNGEINLLKGAIDYSDMITTVSPSYALEITTEEHGCGLDAVLHKNSHKLHGIINGIDTTTYNPKTDTALVAQFSADDNSGKVLDKVELQKMLWLPINKNIPVIAMITRLIPDKGMDIVQEALPEILARGVQFVLIGMGDEQYETHFKRMQDEHDDCVRTVIAFDRNLIHKIYAGADIVLMPSLSEPCGMVHMVASRYGTIPVVRETGGLNDAIIDAYNGDFGNGYKFARYAADDLINAVDRAIGLYRDYNDKWKGLVVRAMRTDYSWSASASEYVKLYNELLQK